MRWLGLVSVAGGLLVLSACGSKVEGLWKGECETEDEQDDYEFDVKLRLEQSGNDITGSSDWELDGDEMDGDVEGEQDGDDFNLTIDLDGDFNEAEAELSLKFEKDELRGDVDIDFEDFFDHKGDCTFRSDD